MIARSTYRFYFSVADVLMILEALRKRSEDSDMRKPEKDSILALINTMKLEIKEQEAEDEERPSTD